MPIVPEPPSGFQRFRLAFALALLGLCVGGALLLRADRSSGGIAIGVLGVAVVVLSLFGFLRYWRSV